MDGGQFLADMLDKGEPFFFAFLGGWVTTKTSKKFSQMVFNVFHKNNKIFDSHTTYLTCVVRSIGMVFPKLNSRPCEAVYNPGFVGLELVECHEFQSHVGRPNVQYLVFLQI